jgi:hypothetical protein
VEFQLYQQKKPEDFTPELLRTVLNLDTIETVNKVTPLPSDQLTRLITFADTNFVRLVNRLSAEEISQLASYLATTAAPPAGLASDLASGQQTVAALLAIPEAEPTAAAATPDSTGFPSMALNRRLPRQNHSQAQSQSQNRNASHAMSTTFFMMGSCVV